MHIARPVQKVSAARRSRRRAFGLLSTAVLVPVLVISLADASSADPPPPLPTLGPAPPNPSHQQISAAQQAKQVLASRVGELGGQIAQAESQLQVLRGKQEFAEQKVALAISELRDAQQAAARARATVQRAERGVAAAHRSFVQYLQATYMDGGADAGAGTLLTAGDPSALLAQGALQHYQATNKLDAIGRLERATVIKSNADAKARAAVAERIRKAAAARQAKAQADAAVATQQQQEAALQATLRTSRAELGSAQLQLATLNHERARFVAYQAERARIARIKARRAARRRRIRAEHLAAARRAAALRAARAAQARARAHRSGGGGRTHQTGGGGGSFVAPGAGRWTPAEAATAVRRVRSTLGTPYAWAGGNSYGPTYGVCDPSNGAPFDCHIYGYDCSGLMMYGWGPYLSMPHFAASQYLDAGYFHPTASQLRPGDLVFWSYNGMVSGIHHVAMYVGNGQIIEAPYSGGYVQTASLWEYGSFFGATRPLS